MSQTEHGIKSIFKYASLYNSFQWLVGSTRARKEVIRNFALPQPEMTVLDIGCGPGTIVPYLPSSIYYFGIDSNPKYIDYASKKFDGRHKFIYENANNIDLIQNLPKFDLILALGLIHHLDDEESSKLFDFASKAATPSGRLITFDGCYTENQSQISRYFLRHDRGQNVRTEPEYKSLAQNHFKNVKTTISHDMLRIPYTSIIMECSI